MKTRFVIYGGIAAVLATASVQADQITGGIELNGLAALNSQNTSISSWPFVSVMSESGSFGSLGAFPKTSSAWNFSSGQTVTVGGFTFDFLSDSVSHSGSSLDITGTGTISANGLTSSTFDWTLIAQNPVAGGLSDITFTANAVASPGGGNGDPPPNDPPPNDPPPNDPPPNDPPPNDPPPSGGDTPVPDGGLTVAFLGLALAGVEGLRRTLIKA